MQIMYQFDLCPETDQQEIFNALDTTFDPKQTREEGYALAQKAWGHQKQADALTVEIAPKWPTYRQPPVDRSIIRLAYYEMISGYAPAKVAINEAIELAKDYASEHSPAFINGVLDKIHKQLKAQDALPDQTPASHQNPNPAAPKDWLNDAKDRS